MATGVLPLVIGNFTRLAQFYGTSEKTYEGTIHFGFSTDTYDAEGEPTCAPTQIVLNQGEVEAAAARFRGVIQQMPPPFSAKKIKGVPAYKLARRQKEVVLQPVQVEVKKFEILSVEADRVGFRARVASGTYIRSLAHDMGKAVGCGAHLESLRRTAVSEFTVEDAHSLADLDSAAGNNRMARGPEHEAKSTDEPLPPYFVHPRKLLPQLPSVTADEMSVTRIRTGRSVNLPDLSQARQIKVFAGQSELIAIATRVAGTLFHPKIVLCQS
jgi:tRNA pseudouridine55 synthase